MSLGKICKDHYEKNIEKLKITQQKSGSYEDFNLVLQEASKRGIKKVISINEFSMSNGSYFKNHQLSNKSRPLDVTFQPLSQELFLGNLKNVKSYQNVNNSDKNIRVFSNGNSQIDDIALENQRESKEIDQEGLRPRSNSECLQCTGQANEKLFDDPEFYKGFNQDSDDSQSEELLNDSLAFSEIKYDLYEGQQRIPDDIENIDFNVGPYDASIELDNKHLNALLHQCKTYGLEDSLDVKDEKSVDP